MLAGDRLFTESELPGLIHIHGAGIQRGEGGELSVVVPHLLHKAGGGFPGHHNGRARHVNTLDRDHFLRAIDVAQAGQDLHAFLDAFSIVSVQHFLFFTGEFHHGSSH